MTATTPSVAQVLRDARNLIAAPERWTQGALARDRCGMPMAPDSPHARRWCMVGAIRVVIVEVDGDLFWDCVDAVDAVDAVSDVIGGGTTAWNDLPGRSHAEVLAAFDEAITAAEAQAVAA